MRAFDGQNSLRYPLALVGKKALCPPEPSRLTLPKGTLPVGPSGRLLRVTPSKPLPERQRTPATALCSAQSTMDPSAPLRPHPGVLSQMARAIPSSAL